jgi:hypothetical protein
LLASSCHAIISPQPFSRAPTTIAHSLFDDRRRQRIGAPAIGTTSAASERQTFLFSVALSCCTHGRLASKAEGTAPVQPAKATACPITSAQLTERRFHTSATTTHLSQSHRSETHRIAALDHQVVRGKASKGHFGRQALWAVCRLMISINTLICRRSTGLTT